MLEASDICWLCGMGGADTVDHVVPRSMGGSDDDWNLRPAHHACNARRGIRTDTVSVSRPLRRA